jgi:hypothetical protein
MNGPQDPRHDYPENAPPPQTPPYGAPQYPPPQYAPPAAAPAPKAYGYLEDPRRKSPLLALILSGMPGLGQVYVGYYNQAFVNMIVCGGTIFLLNLTGRHYVPYGDGAHALQPFLGFFLAFYWLYNMVDAYRRAAFYNQALAGLGPVAFPEDMKLPKGGGSMAGGIALILIGLLLFANTALGMSLDWLEQWWPMGLVLLGAWLVYRNMSEKRAAAPPRTPTTERAERS